MNSMLFTRLTAVAKMDDETINRLCANVIDGGALIDCVCWSKGSDFKQICESYYLMFKSITDHHTFAETNGLSKLECFGLFKKQIA